MGWGACEWQIRWVLQGGVQALRSDACCRHVQKAQSSSPQHAAPLLTNALTALQLSQAHTRQHAQDSQLHGLHDAQQPAAHAHQLLRHLAALRHCAARQHNSMGGWAAGTQAGKVGRAGTEQSRPCACFI